MYSFKIMTRQSLQKVLILDIFQLFDFFDELNTQSIDMQ